MRQRLRGEGGDLHRDGSTDRVDPHHLEGDMKRWRAERRIGDKRQ